MQTETKISLYTRADRLINDIIFTWTLTKFLQLLLLIWFIILVSNRTKNKDNT